MKRKITRVKTPVTPVTGPASQRTLGLFGRPTPHASTYNASATKAAGRRDTHSGKQRPRGIARDLSLGLPPFSTIAEFAAFVHVHPRTIARDIVDGLLIANEFRGVRRISRASGLTYIRTTRSAVGHSKRRRSPHATPVANRAPKHQ